MKPCQRVTRPPPNDRRPTAAFIGPGLRYLLTLFLGLGGHMTAYGAVTCSVTSSGINFAPYDVFALNDNEAVGTVNISCNGSEAGLIATYEMLMSTGNGSFASRFMTNGSHRLNYNIYSNANSSTVWGDGSAGTAVIRDSLEVGSSTADNSYPVYGRIPAGQNAHAGNYSDMLIVTVNY